MRARGPWLDRRGASRLGCLLTLLVLSFVGYYGVDVGSAYMRYWRLLDEMRSQAKVAPSVDDGTIQRRLFRRIESLNLPDDARRRLSIRRFTRPREILISTEYQETLDLPFYRYTHTFRPEARQPL